MKSNSTFAFICFLIACMAAVFAASCGGWHGKAIDSPATPIPYAGIGPTVTLPSSLHGTARGMQWWYEQDDGAGALFGVDYAETGCGDCHTAGCDDCHEDAAGTLPVSEPDTCKACHGRINKEAQFEIADVHQEAGMLCSDCHGGHEVHGDGVEYNSMFEASALDPECSDCHNGGTAPATPDTRAHTIHGDDLACDACHMSTSITCYNCHFETLLDSNEKKAAAGFKDFIILLNDENGQVRGGTYQSVIYEDKGFVAFGPYHGHAITPEGRDCDDCHGAPRMQEYSDTGGVLMTWWDEDEGKVKHTEGVIPFVPDAMEFQFVTLEGGEWTPIDPSESAVQVEFCSPLTEAQLAVLASVPPGEELATSLHGTARGMQWWYENSDGAGPLFGVDYAETGCGNCHVDTAAPDGGCGECHGEASVNDPITNQADVCGSCHGRINKEAQLEITDVHMQAGMVCSDCHSGEEIHGDGNEYDSMFAASALDPECTDCHEGGGAPVVPDTSAHTIHGDDLACDACHMSTSITCYNCHFETLLDSGEKKAAAGFKDFIILVNDENGKVRGGTYQSVIYGDQGFVAFGPYHGHAISSEGRDCSECHGGPRMQEYDDTGRIQMTWWNDAEGKVEHTTGVIPFVPDSMDFQFVTLDGGAWVPISPSESAVQAEFCSPLTESQLGLLTVAPQAEDLATSLHATAAGMQWWYERPTGLYSLIGIDYAETGCGDCHVDTSAPDGGCSDCHGEASVADPIVNQAEVCRGCHGRQNAELNMGLEDVHFLSGMECSDCHAEDVHGDGNSYNSMFEEGAIDADCENCHESVPMSVPEHNLHSEDLHCDACHVETAITCYNCHFDSLITSQQKKAYSPFNGFVLLVNDTQTGKVRAGTYQSVIEGGENTFVAVGPFHGHSVTRDGRRCADCHNNDRITELNDTGFIVIARWDDLADPPGIVHTTGAVPFYPNVMEFEFVDYDAGGDVWTPVGTALDQMQWEFCEPLTLEQMTALGMD